MAEKNGPQTAMFSFITLIAILVQTNAYPQSGFINCDLTKVSNGISLFEAPTVMEAIPQADGDLISGSVEAEDDVIHVQFEIGGSSLDAGCYLIGTSNGNLNVVSSSTALQNGVCDGTRDIIYELRKGDIVNLTVKESEGAEVSVWGAAGFGGPVFYQNISLSKITRTPSQSPSFSPTYRPTVEPTSNPSSGPTLKPSSSPSTSPSYSPTYDPTKNPTWSPSSKPTSGPSFLPSSSPSYSPTYSPTNSPTRPPSGVPTVNPTSSPSSAPSYAPTFEPTNNPTFAPSASPTFAPSYSPSDAPSFSPTYEPTNNPTFAPSRSPTFSPSYSPTNAPSFAPTYGPTNAPTFAPSASPSFAPTYKPTSAPTSSPTGTPTDVPTYSPSSSPTFSPTYSPTSSPSYSPTGLPSSAPTFTPTGSPTYSPTSRPTTSPTASPTAATIPSCEAGNEEAKSILSLVSASSGCTDFFRCASLVRLYELFGDSNVLRYCSALDLLSIYCANSQNDCVNSTSFDLALSCQYQDGYRVATFEECSSKIGSISMSSAQVVLYLPSYTSVGALVHTGLCNFQSYLCLESVEEALPQLTNQS